MKIDRAQWSDASGGYVLENDIRLWQIVGFIDQPAVILRAVTGGDAEHVEILGSITSERFQRLIPERVA